MSIAISKKKPGKKANAKIIKGSFEAISPLAGICKDDKMNLEGIRKQAWR